MRYKCRSDGSKCGDPFSGLADVEGKRTSRAGGDANLFPEHLGDPQKTLSPGGFMIVEILIGL